MFQVTATSSMSKNAEEMKLIYHNIVWLQEDQNSKAAVRKSYWSM